MKHHCEKNNLKERNKRKKNRRFCDDDDDDEKRRKITTTKTTKRRRIKHTHIAYTYITILASMSEFIAFERLNESRAVCYENFMHDSQRILYRQAMSGA